MIILSIVPIACLIVAICKYRKGLVGGELVAAWTWAASAQIFLGIIMIKMESYLAHVNGLIETVYRLLEKIQ